MYLQTPCRVWVAFVSSSRMNGDYKLNPFVFKRKITTSVVMRQPTRQGPSVPTHPVLHEIPRNRSALPALTRAWRMIFPDENNDDDIEANHPRVQVRPEQLCPSPQPLVENVEGADEAYITSAYLSFNGRSLNSIPLEGSTEKSAINDYFMFMKVFKIQHRLSQCILTCLL